MTDSGSIKINMQKVPEPVKTVAESPKFEHIDDAAPLDPTSYPHTKQLDNRECKVINTMQNFQHMCNSYGIPIQQNVISKETLIHIPGLSGISANSNNTKIALLESLAMLNGMTHTMVAKYVHAMADRNPVNPIMTWILSEGWDGLDRLQLLYDTLQTRDDYPLEFKNLLLHCWLLSLVAAASLSTGFHSRGILTLQGPQGVGKTSWFRNLIPAGILRDSSILTGHHLDPGNKDSVTTAIKHWIVEIGELDSSFKKDVARLKGFITQDKDSVRRPYAPTNSDYPRQTVFCASVNEENFLIDQTGNTRFWTLPLIGIDYEHDIDMQQVYSQLYIEILAGASWWLKPKQDTQLEELNQSHKAISALEEQLLEVWNMELPEDKRKYMSASEQLRFIGIRTFSNPQCRDCGAINRKYFGPPKKIRGIMKWKVPLDTSDPTSIFPKR
jgi:hypothetical protein